MARAIAPARQLGVADTQEVDVPWAPVPVSLATRGDRRLEARTYLTDGYGIRSRIEATGTSRPFNDVAAIWQPSRLKGYVVGEGLGLPFLSAGQVFEGSPRVRKWLAAAMVSDAESRAVERSWILLSCSGEVGRVTAVYNEHLDKIITHDLLRVVPHDAEDYGWLYAYMRTPSFYAVARSSQYGHMIKHLEPGHVQAMPVLYPDRAARKEIGAVAKEAIERRIRSREMQNAADELYSRSVNPSGTQIGVAVFHTVPISELEHGRRRLEGQYVRSEVRQIEAMVRSSATRGVDTVRSVTESVTLGNRFKRYFGPNGTPYRSASELFDVNAPVTKRIYSALLENANDYMLHDGWIVMACSGQTYGLLGRARVLTPDHEGVFGSHDLIRIVPDKARIRTGYLQTVLNHQKYGRPLVIRHASGTSIPHLDPVDIREVPIPRLEDGVEAEIADLCLQSVAMSAEADRLESEAARRAEELIERATGQHGETLSLVADD